MNNGGGIGSKNDIVWDYVSIAQVYGLWHLFHFLKSLIKGINRKEEKREKQGHENEVNWSY